MANEIIPYLEMCQREGLSLQRGMNFDSGRGYSVILMSVRRNAPYRDRFEDDGSTLIYEGHDAPRSAGLPDPKSVDQPERTPKGTPTQNGKFYYAVEAFKQSERPAPIVRVYEKIHDGIWAYNGLFEMVDAWKKYDGVRHYFRFRLVISSRSEAQTSSLDSPRRRLIPTRVKVEVWKRDQGRCIQCGATSELHFDHDFPFSRGGTSLTAANVQLLCARHNLSKGAKIL